jgi:hypothetical protein
VNIRNDFGIDKVDECIVHKSVIDRAGVKDGEVSVFNTRRMKIGVGVSMSMQSHVIDRVTLLVTSLDSHSISD